MFKKFVERADQVCAGQRIMCSSACENQGVEVHVDDLKSQIDDTSALLELAANDDFVGFRQAVESGMEIDAVGHWYGRQNGSNQMVSEQRTPAMIASLYGSLNVLNFILSEYTEHDRDINRRCGSDGSTALHCAAAGGSMQAPATVRILLDYGADPKVLDFQGHRPGDVIIVSPKLPHVKVSLESMLLVTSMLYGSLPIHVSDKLLEPRIPPNYLEGSCFPHSEIENGFVLEPDNGYFLPLTISSSQSPSPETSSSYLSSPLFSSSPKLLDIEASKMHEERLEKPRDYPIDPSLPDIKNSSYTTDEFRMFSFKIRPCSRAYSHDWTECPFVHPGENARRRDPRRYHYSCVPCPDFRKGACKRGDACEYAHGVFECWLHPAQYRTRLCKDGLNCNRRVCFFAHTTDELRSLYVSTGSVGPSQRALTCLDTMSLGPSFAPSSPSSVLMMSPFSPNSAHNTFSTPPMSPSTTVSSLGVAWQAGHDIPTLQLPVASLQGSRLRASLNARELSVDSINGASEYEGQFVSEFSGIPSPIFSSKALANAANGASGCGNAAFRMGKFRSTDLRGSPSPAKLEELFSAEMLPLSMLHDSSLLSQVGSRIQGQKTDEMQLKLMQSQINSKTFPQMPTQHQVQPQLGVSKPQMLQSPFNFSSSNVPSFSGFDSEQQNHRQSLLEDSPFVLASPSQAAINLNMQSSNMGSVSPASAASLSALLQKDKPSRSSRDLWAGLVPSDWGSPTGKAEWGVQKDDLCRLRKINSCKLQNSEEPVVSWSQKLGIEAQNDTDPSLLCSTEISDDALTDTMDHSVLSSWIEQMPA